MRLLTQRRNHTQRRIHHNGFDLVPRLKSSILIQDWIIQVLHVHCLIIQFCLIKWKPHNVRQIHMRTFRAELARVIGCEAKMRCEQPLLHHDAHLIEPSILLQRSSAGAIGMAFTKCCQ